MFIFLSFAQYSLLVWYVLMVCLGSSLRNDMTSRDDVHYGTCPVSDDIYSGAQGLRFISDYDLKTPRQIFPIDSDINLLCDNNIFGDFDLKMSKIGD